MRVTPRHHWLAVTLRVLASNLNNDAGTHLLGGIAALG
jgi:hypothetical protein